MKIHNLKTLPEFFQHVWTGDKLFEVRNNDREFETGDKLFLYEYDAGTGQYLGRYIIARATYILDNWEPIEDGYVVIGLHIECNFSELRGGQGR